MIVYFGVDESRKLKPTNSKIDRVEVGMSVKRVERLRVVDMRINDAEYTIRNLEQVVIRRCRFEVEAAKVLGVRKRRRRRYTEEIRENITVARMRRRSVRRKRAR